MEYSMPTQFPITSIPPLEKAPLFAPGSFRRVAQYRFQSFKPRPKRPAHPLFVNEQKSVFPQRKVNPTNIIFYYLYRDASNYKQYGEAIFTNQTFLLPNEIEQQIRALLKDGEFFIARQINIEERFFDALRDDDHPWHTFERVEVTTLAPFDPDNWSQKQHRRDITEFIANLGQAHQAGWDEMNVRADLENLLGQKKARLRANLEK
jgi:hypothetical protein